MTDQLMTLEDRVDRLEHWLHDEQKRSDRLRMSVAGLAVGVATLFVAMSLPWLERDRPIVAGTVFKVPIETTSTGWQLLVWAVSDPDGARGTWLTTIAMMPSIIGLLAGAVALLWFRRGYLIAAAVLAGAGTLGLLCLLIGWDSHRTVQSSGMVTGVLACAAITAGAWIGARQLSGRP